MIWKQAKDDMRRKEKLTDGCHATHSPSRRQDTSLGPTFRQMMSSCRLAMTWATQGAFDKCTKQEKGRKKR